jgi:hypothetical protein
MGATVNTKKAVTPKTVLVLRTCAADMTSYNGFKWPAKGPVEAPDWKATAECGHGLHGLLWGEGDGSLLDWSGSAKWLVVQVDATSTVDLYGKVKFPRGNVVYCGDRLGATEYIRTNGGEGRCIHGGTATAGYLGTATAGHRGTATAGYRGTATAGDLGTATAGYRGTATAGDLGTATAGDRGTATAGYLGTATAGESGVIAILRWNGKQYKYVVATVKDADGDGQLEPNTPYKLDENGNFVAVKS